MLLHRLPDQPRRHLRAGRAGTSTSSPTSSTTPPSWTASSWPRACGASVASAPLPAQQHAESLEEKFLAGRAADDAQARRHRRGLQHGRRHRASCPSCKAPARQVQGAPLPRRGARSRRDRQRRGAAARSTTARARPGRHRHVHLLQVLRRPSGGFVAGDEDVIDYIKHFARSLIFSASMPPATIASVGACLTHHRAGARAGAAPAGDRPQDGGGLQVAGVQRRDTRRRRSCRSSSATSKRRWCSGARSSTAGVFTNPVLSPAVPPDSTLIRTSYMAIHTDAELDQILEVAGKAGKALGII